MSVTYYHDLVQNTDEWHAARCGLLTASAVGKLLTPTLKIADNATSRGLVLLLASERITGRTEPTALSDAMWRGVEDEPHARDSYAEHFAAVAECGLVVRDEGGVRIGYSPDGLVGADGLIEIKSRAPKLQVATILADAVPDEHIAQIQCGLLVSGREWCDYVSYSAGMPLWTKRVLPDAAWQDAILLAAEQFEASMADALERYRVAVEGLPTTERYDMEMVI